MVDILNTLLQIRRYRPNMVANMTQFKALYEMLATHVSCGTTVIPVQNLDVLVRHLIPKPEHSKFSGFEVEFKVRTLIVHDCFVHNKLYQYCSSLLCVQYINNEIAP